MNSDTTRVPGVLVPPPFLFAGALAVGLILQIMMPRPIFSRFGVGRVAGGLLIALGLSLSLAVILVFRRVGTAVSPRRPTRHLVGAGPYRFSRNPDYLGQAVVCGGFALLLNSLWILLACVPVLLLVRYQVIAREERYLEDLFGESYRRYCERVRRWL